MVRKKQKKYKIFYTDTQNRESQDLKLEQESKTSHNLSTL